MPRIGYALSLPERIVRGIVVVLAGTLHESAEVVLPRFLRQSRIYEATAKNVLRISIELVGGAEPSPKTAGEPTAGSLAKRKVAGNVVELGSIAAFGFSPLWLLAAASDLTHGTRTYLDTLVDELRLAGVVREGDRFETVDDLLRALESSTGTTARLIDIPPLELSSLRETLADLRSDVADLPSPDELARLFSGLQAEAAREKRSLLDVSADVGLAFLVSARRVGGRHILTPYREDLGALRAEGFAAYTKRVSRVYRSAVTRNLDPARPSYTERGLSALTRARD